MYVSIWLSFFGDESISEIFWNLIEIDLVKLLGCYLILNKDLIIDI